MKLTNTLAKRVASKMRARGYHWCTTAHVFATLADGTLPGNESLASAILQEFEELEVEVPHE